MTRRISRAKQRIRDSRAPFRMPADDERAERLAAVLHTLYLIFNEGYATTSGPTLQRAELAAEAIRWRLGRRTRPPRDGRRTSHSSATSMPGPLASAGSSSIHRRSGGVRRPQVWLVAPSGPRSRAG